MEVELQDVAIGAPDAASTEVTDSSTVVEPSGESQASVTGTDETAQSTVETQAEVDPLEGLPTLEELQAQEAQKVPYAAALSRLRPAYEGLKAQIDEYKALDAWKPVIESIADPVLVQTAHELVTAIHTPSTENPSGFTSRPFLERLESESPGSVDQLFADTLTFTVPDEAGKPSTVVRELVKSWGLNPDRFDEYRNIDTLRASGVVTAEDISKVPEQYQAAFKSLSQPAREDLLSLKDSNPAAFEEYLRNANDALEARSWREKDEAARRQAAQEAQQQYEQQVTQAVEQDLITETQAISDSVHQNLSSQFTFSSDATVNALEHSKILGVLGNLQSPFPVYRDMAVKALKAVGVEPNGFDELANRLTERREAYVRFNAMGDKMQAQRALSEATLAKQQILAKANDYAMRLAKASGQRAAAAAQQQEQQLGQATARFVPSGAGQAPQGAENPYMQNPHQPGTQEYFAYYRQLDKQFKLNGASLLGGN